MADSFEKKWIYVASFLISFTIAVVTATGFVWHERSEREKSDILVSNKLDQLERALHGATAALEKLARRLDDVVARDTTGFIDPDFTAAFDRSVRKFGREYFRTLEADRDWRREFKARNPALTIPD